jgi:ribosomal protein S4
MRRLNKYCFNRCQPKLSANPENIYNLRRFKPFDDAKLDVWSIEWKSKTLTRLFFNGDVKHSWFRRFFRANGRHILTTLCENEKRLDNAIFRALFSESIFKAAKLVSDGRVAVNGNIIRQPSFLLHPGDLVTLDGKAREKLQDIEQPWLKWIRFWSFVPPYLEVSYKTASFVLISTPEYKDIPHPFPRWMIDALGRFYHRY